VRFFTLIVINLLGLLSFSVLAQPPQTLVPIDPAINEVFQLISSNEKVRGSLQLIEAIVEIIDIVNYLLIISTIASIIDRALAPLRK
jgi:hypothetical protein